jgi:hypothetical protein
MSLDYRLCVRVAYAARGDLAFPEIGFLVAHPPQSRVFGSFFCLVHGDGHGDS